MSLSFLINHQSLNQLYRKDLLLSQDLRQQMNHALFLDTKLSLSILMHIIITNDISQYPMNQLLCHESTQ